MDAKCAECEEDSSHDEDGRPLCDDHCTAPGVCGDCGWQSHCKDFHACELPYAD